LTPKCNFTTIAINQSPATEDHSSHIVPAKGRDLSGVLVDRYGHTSCGCSEEWIVQEKVTIRIKENMALMIEKSSNEIFI